MWFMPSVLSLIEFFITILGHKTHRFNLKIIFKQQPKSAACAWGMGCHILCSTNAQLESYRKLTLTDKSELSGCLPSPGTIGPPPP